MRLNKDYHGVNFSKAFNAIRRKTQRQGAPILIVRTDDVKKVYKMRSFINSINNCTYIKLGVACSMDKIYRILFEQIGHGKYEVDADQNQLVNLIIQKINSSTGRYLLVIDNCQHLFFPNILRLVGLMLELAGKVQFVFLLPEEYIAKWRLLVGFKEIIILKLIPLKYDFTR